MSVKKSTSGMSRNPSKNRRVKPKTSDSPSSLDWLHQKGSSHSFLASAQLRSRKTVKNRVILIGKGIDHKEVKKELKETIPGWQLSQLGVAEDWVKCSGPKGAIWVVNVSSSGKEKTSPSQSSLQQSSFGRARDLAGRLYSEIANDWEDSLEFDLRSQDSEELLGFLVGLELASYSFKVAAKNSASFENQKVYLTGLTASLFQEALSLASAQNIARHLVNIPPNELTPVTYANTVKALFSGKKGVKVEIWDEVKLAKENMNLMLAVGQASAHKPRLVKLQYRPASFRGKTPQIIFVGKGITFDSGGLDIKPASGMRLMKKDMGGSAALVGYLNWLVDQSLPIAVDVYLGLAENAISSNAFRPGDIYYGRNGKSVEIHNTDAEGRLVLADVLALANETADEKTAWIGSVATLTGAAKVGLGADIAAFYSTSDDVARLAEDVSFGKSDHLWRMPLYQPYLSLLRSHAADINHCASSPFGGSITAALYLREYVTRCPFMHFDIYGWNDRARGALREPGGSGQAVQTLIAMTKRQAQVLREKK